MTCEGCNKEKATVSWQLITNGEKKKSSYCANCAKNAWLELPTFTGPGTCQMVSIFPIKEVAEER